MPVLFLHGWGGNARSFASAMNYFASGGRTCVAPDFPPFGSSSQPPENWSLGDYTDMTVALLDKLGIEKAVVVGHSFGGRVAIDLASRTERVAKLALVDAAGLRPRRGIKYRLRRARFRLAKAAGTDTQKFYSPDWRALPPAMRGVFARVVAEDLTPRLPYITCPTLIVWGDKDRDTPPYMAKRLHKGIKNSKIAMIDGGHFAYAERHFAFVATLSDFIGD